MSSKQKFWYKKAMRPFPPIMRCISVLSIFIIVCSVVASCVEQELHPIVSAQNTGTTQPTETDSSTTTATSDSETGSNLSDTDTNTSTDTDTTTTTEVDTTTDTDTSTSLDTDSQTDAPLSKWVGSATQNYTIPYDFENLWEQVTPEAEGTWASVEYIQDIMDWSALDAIHELAIEKDLVFKQHTFIWGNQVPEWMNDLSLSEQEEEVEEWIEAFCKRYPDVKLINVVHQPNYNAPSYKYALGGDGESGYDWVIWAFETAREYCGDATLILNSYNVLRWNTDGFLEMVDLLHEKKLIDAIGCAAQGLEGQSITELKTNLDLIAETGLPIYISEYDVDLSDDQEQLETVKAQFPIFYEHPRVAGITFWGYVENQTWSTNAYLRREDGTSRPALDWLTEYLGRPLDK